MRLIKGDVECKCRIHESIFFIKNRTMKIVMIILLFQVMIITTFIVLFIIKILEKAIFTTPSQYYLPKITSSQLGYDKVRYRPS